MQISVGSVAPVEKVGRRFDYHVVPMSNIWAVKGEHSPSYLGMFYTQFEAKAYAVGLARIAASSVIVHGRGGKIRDVLSYDVIAGPRLIVRG